MFQDYDIGETFTKFPDTLALNQTNLLCDLSPAIDEDMIVHSLRGEEAISSPYVFYVNLLSKNNAIDGEPFVGSTTTVQIRGDYTEEVSPYNHKRRKDFNKKESEEWGNYRHINGIITRFAQGTTNVSNDFPLTHYIVEIRPKLWTLTLNKECKVFQNKTGMDIITEVLSNAGIEFEDNTQSRGKTERVYCVQYYESDFAFVSRLMEEEGIFYFFKHGMGTHIMVLCDDVNVYQPSSSAVIFAPTEPQSKMLSTVNTIKTINSYRPGAYAETDYNYTTSQSSLLSSITGNRTQHEIFEYPGNYQVLSDGDAISKTRLEEMEQTTVITAGDSKAYTFTPGYTFSLSDHPSPNFNKTYVVCSLQHTLDFSAGHVYKNKFIAMESTVPFRPPRVTPKPVIYGVQPAVVTGPAGEEIYTDEYRRIKVQFYWDREGANDENTSCWVRVAQVFSGNNWGGLYTPRIGQEVVVNFENGDPDRPIVIGCVYNDMHMPPYSDTDATKSTLKTVSSKGEDGFNEIRFEDLKDSEEIYVHAQKDMNIDIINERTTLIEESNDTLTIDKGSRTELLNAAGGDPGNYTTTLTKGDITITIKEGNETVTLNKGNMTVTLDDGNMDVSIKGNYTINVDGDLSISTTGKITVDAKKDISTKSMMNIKTEATMNMDMKANMNATLSAVMNLMCEGQLNATIKAGVAMNVMGVNTTVNGSAATTVSAGGSCQITAPSVVIGGGAVAIG